MRRLALPVLILLSACSSVPPEGTRALDSIVSLDPPGEIAFTRGGEIWLAPAKSGVEHKIATDLVYQLDRPLTWLPDGSQLVIWDHTGGWVQWSVDPATRKRTALTSAGDHRSPAFTADGRWMAWMNGTEGLCVREMPDGPIRVLSVDGHRDVAPTWSPDGQRLAWVVYEPVEGTCGERLRSVVRVFEMANGATREVARGDNPAWSPRTSQIAFAAGELTLIDADTGVLTTLTSGAERAGPPAWSPNGDEIACIVGAETDRELRIFAADGSVVRAIAQVEHQVFGNVPTWSPDGAWIAWMDGAQGEVATLIGSTDGATASPRTLATDGALFPVWRPR